MEDFFTRFKSRLGSINTSPLIKPSLVQRLQKSFERIVFDCQLEKNWSKIVDQTDIPTHLQEILDVMVKESVGSRDGGIEAGGCTERFLNNDMLSDLLRVSENDVPVGFREEVIKFMSNLISVLDGKMLIQNAIHRPALHLMRQCQKHHKFDDLILELEYNIVAKIREHPQLLQVFFVKNFIPKNVSRESVNSGKISANASLNKSPSKRASAEELAVAENSNQEYEFLLFDHLLRYIHQGDQNGDVARTAVLFLLEINDPDLGKYVEKSDFSTVAVAGLGGLFSQLPPSLPSHFLRGKRRKYEIKEFNDDLDSFLKLLEFVQRIVLVSPHKIIIDRVLRDLRQTFLENIVLSSISSSSDFDGSTVACLFYLDRMIGVVNEYQLSQCFSQFLLQSEDEVETDDIRLNLRDILISKLNSLSEEVVTTNLHLFQTLLQFHNATSLELLFEKLPRQISPIKMDVKHHCAVVHRCMAMIKDTGNMSGCHSLQSYIQEAERMKATYKRGLRKGVVMSNNSTILFPASHSVYNPDSSPLQITASQIELMGKDTILLKFLIKLSTFFSHTFEINVALTGLIAQLASVPHPAMYMYMYHSDALVEGESSLMTVFQKLDIEMREFAQRIGEDFFEKRIALVRPKVYAHEGGKESARLLMPPDIDEEFLWNCVLLEEVAKELLAVILGHSVEGLDFLSYL